MFGKVMGRSDDRDPGVLTHLLQKRAEHLIMELVDLVHDIPVQLKIAFGHVRHAGRIIRHENMTGDIDRIEKDGRKIPRLSVQGRGEDTLDGDGLGEDFSQLGRSRVHAMVNAIDRWQDRLDIARR
jgi:hypothetical protein